MFLCNLHCDSTTTNEKPFYPKSLLCINLGIRVFSGVFVEPNLDFFCCYFSPDSKHFMFQPGDSAARVSGNKLKCESVCCCVIQTSQKEEKVKRKQTHKIFFREKKHALLVQLLIIKQKWLISAITLMLFFGSKNLTKTCYSIYLIKFFPLMSDS